jgi:hypothetical protein
MAHQYRQRILVTLRANGEPSGLVWRGATYSVVEVLARWRLRDRWWATSDWASTGDTPPGGASASDRSYYRLRCAEGLLCEVYWDAAAGAWTLDRVLD